MAPLQIAWLHFPRARRSIPNCIAMIGFALGLAIFGLYTHHLVNPDNLDPTSALKEVHSDGSLDYLVRGLHYTFRMIMKYWQM